MQWLPKHRPVRVRCFSCYEWASSVLCCLGRSQSQVAYKRSDATSTQGQSPGLARGGCGIARWGDPWHLETQDIQYEMKEGMLLSVFFCFFWFFKYVLLFLWLFFLKTSCAQDWCSMYQPGRLASAVQQAGQALQRHSGIAASKSIFLSEASWTRTAKSCQSKSNSNLESSPNTGAVALNIPWTETGKDLNRHWKNLWIGLNWIELVISYNFFGVSFGSVWWWPHQDGVLLLLGPEGPGLHDDLKERCDVPLCFQLENLLEANLK